MKLQPGRTFVLIVFLSIMTVTGIRANAEPTRSPSTANASTIASGKAILNYLSALPSQPVKHLIIGQFGAYGDGEDAASANLALQRIRDQSGKWVGLTGMDYHPWDMAHLHDYTEPNQYLIDKWNKGMIVTLSWHAGNPWTGKEADDAAMSGGASYPIHDLLDARTAVHAKWLTMLDDVAGGLDQLQRAGVVVIWRPFHEMNGSWFGWGQQSPTEFTALWRQMFNYFVIDKGLNNLLWAYSPNYAYDHWTPGTTAYFPGSGYVDVVGMDKYRDRTEDPLLLNEFSSYDDLVATGKPVALMEFGPSPADGSGWQDAPYDWTKLLRDVRTKYPKLVFVQAWEYIWQIGYGANVNGLMNDPWSITLSDLPAWTGGSPTPLPTPTVGRPSATATSPGAPGKVYYQQWNGIDSAGGTQIESLETNPNFPDTPDICTPISSFDAPSGVSPSDGNWGGRIVTRLVPPVSGDYAFWFASDDQGKLFFNPTGRDPSGKRLIVGVPNAKAPRVTWMSHLAFDDKHRSVTFQLVAGKSYYVESYYVQASGGYDMSVAWGSVAAARIRSARREPASKPV